VAKLSPACDQDDHHDLSKLAPAVVSGAVDVVTILAIVVVLAAIKYAAQNSSLATAGAPEMAPSAITTTGETRPAR
jgi:hypothetical protein